MKLFLIAPANSIHTKRWVKSLAEKGYDIFLFSFSDTTTDKNIYYNNINIYECGINDTQKISSKIRYLLSYKKLKRAIKKFNPDIVHAHYASSYGLVGTLLNFHPFIVSVWGSDIYDFPKKNILYRFIIKFVLKRADCILSTSHKMAKVTSKYTKKEIFVTPFGVDTSLFKKGMVKIDWGSECVIGNVKTLAPKYGIDILIKAFKHFRDNNISLNPKLIIIGDGPFKEEYLKLAQDLDLNDNISFLGQIPNSELPTYYNSFSLTVFPSIYDSESFGVVAVESMSCECPVVVSDADGFTEVVENGLTGIIVPKFNIEATANAIQELILDNSRRIEMGMKGRERVLRLYDWNKNVRNMESIYEHIVRK